MATVSIVIATHRAWSALDACLTSIAQQTFPLDALQIIVGFNGMPEPPAPPDEIERLPLAIETAHTPAANVGRARNLAFERCRGECVLLLNDDVALAPDAIERHLAAHRALGSAAMVLGSAEWKCPEHETIFDRMIRRTSMIFFYDRMRPRNWYGFRHCWTLNLSLARSWCERVRFDETIAPVNFDDLEWGFRLEREHGLRVWYEPAARCEHDHRYTLDGYLERERRLGVMAVRLARANPACFEAIHGRCLDDALLDDYATLIAADEPRENDMYEALTAIAGLPASLLPRDAAEADALTQVLQEAQRPLKKLHYRRSLVEAARKSNHEHRSTSCA